MRSSTIFTSRNQPVDHYQTLARQYLDSYPAMAATVGDPDRWAADTAEQIRSDIRRLTHQLTETDPTASYPDRRAALTTAARTAEELVLADLLPTPPSPTSGEDQDWQPLVPDLHDLL